jgi:hypothetical protein
LKIAEEGLASFPGDPNLIYGKALCLIGLFRNREALQELAPLAQSHPERPDFALTFGRAQFYAGDDLAAMRTWSELFGSPSVAEEAYSLSVWALLASGQEDKARGLIEDARTRLPKASAELMRYGLDLVHKASEGLPLLAELVTIDPQNASTYEALRQLYKAGGDKPFFEVRMPPGGITEIALKRTFRPRENNAIELNNDMGGSITSSSFSEPVLTISASIDEAPPETMIFDSGSPLVFVSPQLAKRLALKPVSRASYAGMGGAGTFESSWVFLKSLKVGDVVFQQVPAVVLSRDVSFLGESSGIIPLSLFKHQAIVYDPAGPSLKIMPAGTSPEKALGAGSFEVRTEWFKGCPLARASIQGLSELFCLLDTGSFSTFIAPDVVPGLYTRTDSQELQSTRRKTGLSGGFEPMVARQIRLCLGERCTTLSEVQVAPIPLPYGVPCAGIIGRNILDQYVVFLDYGANRAFFKRRER